MITEYLEKGIKEFYIMSSCDDPSSIASYKVQIHSHDENYAIVKNPQDQIEKIPICELIPIDEVAESGPSDLLLLNSINECSLLQSLKSRHKKNLFNSTIGKIFIQIRGLNKLKNSPIDPEIFNISTKILKKLKFSSQSLVFVGETASGKTQTFDKILKCLFSYNKNVNLIKAAWFLVKSFTTVAVNGKCGDSRFVVQVKIFGNDGDLDGCAFECFCVDRNMVFRKKTKNFAVFYMMGVDMDDDEMRVFNKSLRSHLLLDLGKSEEKMIKKFKSSIEKLGLIEEFKEIQKVLYAILCLGNLEFIELGKQVTIKKETLNFLKYAAKFLSIPEDSLQKQLMTFTSTIGKNIHISKLDIYECDNRRNNLMRHLYLKLLEWILSQINKVTGPNLSGNSITLIDYPGSQSKDQNNLEELLINYTNEKFHQLCISTYFKKTNKSLSLTNNLPILNLLENQSIGILKYLNDSCKETSSFNFFSKIKSNHKLNEYFESNFSEFSIYHSFKKVTYNPINFRKDNQTVTQSSLQSIIETSKNRFISLVFRTSNSKNELNSELIQNYLDKVFENIENTKVRFLYCLNPYVNLEFNEKYLLMQIQNFSLIDFIVQFKNILTINYTSPELFRKYRFVLNSKLTTEKNIEKLCEELDIRKDHFCINNQKIFISKSCEKVLNKHLQNIIKKFSLAAVAIQRIWKFKYGIKKIRRFFRAIVKIQALFRCKKEYMWFLYMKQNAIIIQRWFRQLLSEKLENYKVFGLGIFNIYLRSRMKKLLNKKRKRLALTCQKLWRGFKTRKHLRPSLLCLSILSSILQNSWLQIEILLQTQSAIKIQKHFRGYQTRKSSPFQHLLETLQIQKSAKTIQKNIKRYLVQKKFQTLQNSAKFIQSFWRLHRYKQHLKNSYTSILLIQKHLKKFLIRLRQIKSRLANFLITESSLLTNLRYLEHSSVFSRTFPMPQLKDSRLQVLSQISQSSGNLSRLKLINSGSLSPTSREINPFHLEKMSFMCQVAQLNIYSDISIVYEGTWGAVLESIYAECVNKEDLVMDVKLGDCHSVALTSRGKVFAWGWNDKGQCLAKCPRFRFVKELKDFRVLQVECGEDHTLALAETGEVLAFGDNAKGQLGAGHYSAIKSVHQVVVPKAAAVYAKFEVNVVLTKENSAFVWPLDDENGAKSSLPCQVLNNVQVVEASIGFRFVMLLSNAGVLYSFGDNDCGQLATGDFDKVEKPKVVAFFQKTGDRITNVAAGLNHCVGRTSLGKLFVWGGNHKGQLGMENIRKVNKPVLVGLGKVSQVSSGNGLSLILLESRKLYFSGEGVSQFQELSIPDHLPEYSNPKDFALVRGKVEWTRQMSIILLTFCDLRSLQTSYVRLQKGMDQLSLKWGKSIEPPIIEPLAAYYPVVSWRRSPLRNF